MIFCKDKRINAWIDAKIESNLKCPMKWHESWSTQIDTPVLDQIYYKIGLNQYYYLMKWCKSWFAKLDTHL